MSDAADRNKQPFSLECVTCGSRLKVADVSMVGHVLPCPKCGSMVEIEVPGAVTASVSVAGPMPQVSPPPFSGVEPPGAEYTGAEPTDAESEGVIPQLPVAPRSVLQKRLMLAVVGMASLVVLLGIWATIASQAEDPPADVAETSHNEKVQDNLSPGTEVSESQGPESQGPESQGPESQGKEPSSNEATSQGGAQNTPAPAAEPSPSQREPTLKEALPISTPPEASVAIDPLLIPAEEEVSNEVNPKLIDQEKVEETSKSPTSVVPLATTKEGPVPGDVRPLPAASADVLSRLEMKLPGFQAAKMPLRQFVTLLSELSAMSIEYDAATLAQVGMTADSPVKVDLQDARVREVLAAALASRGLSFVVTGDKVVLCVTPREKASLRSRRIFVEDLVEDEAPVAWLTDLIYKMVAPESWKAAGGRGELTVNGNVLTVTQTRDVQYQLLVFCEKLRVARGEKTTSRFDPARYYLEAEHPVLKKALSQPVTIRTGANETFQMVVRRMESASSLAIAIDALALAKIGHSSEMIVSLLAENQRLSDVLTTLLKPYALAYEVVDHRTLRITSRRQAQAKYSIVFYDTAAWGVDTDSAQGQIERLKQQVAPDSWADGRGATVLDPVSRRLIVRQHSENHRQLAATLARR